MDATQEWRAIARGPDVLFHICSWPEKKGRWTPEDFYAAGRSDWADFRRHWIHYEPDVLGGRCVEIGCGAGRMTAALAPDFSRVVAVDVSDDMIAAARGRVGETVEFHRVDEPRIPVPDGDADAVFSVHVLQHLERPEDVRRYLDETLRVLRPGGTAMIHIMIYDRPPTRLRRLRYEVALRRSRARLGRGEEHTFVRMTLFTLGEAQRLLGDVGFTDIEMRSIPLSSNGSPHTLWLVRKPGRERVSAVDAP